MKFFILSCLTLVLINTPVAQLLAGPEHDKMAPYKGSAEFEQLKRLVGDWSGTHKMGEKIENAQVRYQLTSNGSAIVETLFTGTPMEMVTVYYDKTNKLAMTHYCAFGNQPQMDMVHSTADEITFLLSDRSEIAIDTEGHMHALKIIFINDNKIEHQWTMFQNGQEEGMTIIELVRDS